MNQMICAVAFVGLTLGPAQATMTFVKEGGSQAILVIPEDQTASVLRGDEVLLTGHTILDPDNVRETSQNSVRLLPKIEHACPPLRITFSRDFANLSFVTEELSAARIQGTCDLKTIAGRYRLLRSEGPSH